MVANSNSSAGGSGPTLWSRGNDQFGVWVSASESVYVSKFNRSSRTLVSSYDLANISGNPLSLPLDSADTHEAPSLAVDAQGYIWVAANMWGTATARVVRSASPLNHTSWVDVSAQFSPLGQYSKLSYFNFGAFADGGLFLLFGDRNDTPTPGDNPSRSRRFYLAPRLLERCMSWDEELHPKLEIMAAVTADQIRQFPESRIIIFARFRDMVQQIVEYLVGRGINADRFVGQATRDTDRGLTQKKQIDALRRFREGEFRVLVATGWRRRA